MDKEKLKYVKCDLCDSDNSKILFKDVTDTHMDVAGRFNVVSCQNCGLIYLNPRVKPEFINKYYPSELYGPYQKESPMMLRVKKIIWRTQKKLIKKYVARGGNVLEIGCARGDFLNFLKTEYSPFGIEMNEYAVKAARQCTGITVERGTFEDFDFGDRKFNLIIMFFVLEHLPSVSLAFRKMRSISAPRGVLMLSVPNYNSWDRMVFGEYWHSLDVPRHYYIFTDKIMRQYAKKYGFKILALRHDFVPNDWIGGIGRFFRAKRWLGLANFFMARNRLAAILFLPLSLAAYLFKKSSRVTYILRLNQ